MKFIKCITVFVFFYSGLTQAYETLEIVPRGLISRPMDSKNLKFISDRLYLDKLADNLDCEVRVSETKKDRKFSNGIKIVEMLEVRYISRRFRQDEHVAFFPIGSLLTIQRKNSNLAGAVEEFKLESNDLYNTQFIFQHDGQGHIVWINFVSDLTTLPCGLKK